MDGGNYMSISTNGKLVKNQEQQWGFVKEETFSSDHFQWPARRYACNFCRREFKSAQALGGHMNVHRRDRARFRYWPSWVPNNSYPTRDVSLPPPPSCFTFRSNISNSLCSVDEGRKTATGSCSWNKPSSGPQGDEVLHVLKKKRKKSSVNLELKMGNLVGCSNEDLDLELHL